MAEQQGSEGTTGTSSFKRTPPVGITVTGITQSSDSRGTEESLRQEKMEDAEGLILLTYLREHGLLTGLQGPRYGICLCPAFGDYLRESFKCELDERIQKAKVAGTYVDELEAYEPPLRTFRLREEDTDGYRNMQVILIPQNSDTLPQDLRSEKRSRDEEEMETASESKRRRRMRDNELEEQLPYPIRSMLKLGRSGIRFGSPLGNPLLQNRQEHHDELLRRASEFWPDIYNDLTLEGYSDRRHQTHDNEHRRYQVEKMIQSQVKNARRTSPPSLGNPKSGNVSLWLLEWVFAFVRDLEIHSGFALEYLMLPFPTRPPDWERTMPYWNAMVTMEREVLVRLQRATETNTSITQQITEAMDVTSHQLFQMIISLYMGQPLELYTKNRVDWNELSQGKGEQVGVYLNKVQKYVRMFQFTLDPLTFTDISSKLYTTLRTPQLWLFAAAEAVRMATTHSFELAAWFKAINDHELAYKSNEEITGELPLQIQTANRVRPNSLKTPSAWCKICQKNTHWTYECPNQKNERKPAYDTGFSKYRNNMSPAQRGPMNTPRNIYERQGRPPSRILPPRDSRFTNRPRLPDRNINGNGRVVKHMTSTTSRDTTNKPLENEINYICKDIEANMFANKFNFNEQRSDPLQLLMLTSAIEEVLQSQPCNPICKSLTLGDFTSKEIEQENKVGLIPSDNCPVTSAELSQQLTDMDKNISDDSEGDLPLSTAEVLGNSDKPTSDVRCANHPTHHLHSRVSYPEQIPTLQWEYLDSDDDISERTYQGQDMPIAVATTEGDGNELNWNENEDGGSVTTHSAEGNRPNLAHSVDDTDGVRDSTIVIHAGGDDNPCWIQQYNERRTAFLEHNMWIYSALGRWTASKRRRIGNFSAMYFQNGQLNQEMLEELEDIKRDMSVLAGTVLESSVDLHADVSLLQTVMEETGITFPLPVLEHRLEPMSVFAFVRDVPVKFELSPVESEYERGEDSVESSPVDITPLVHSTASEGSASTGSQDLRGMPRDEWHTTLRLRGGGDIVGGKRTREGLVENQTDAVVPPILQVTWMDERDRLLLQGDMLGGRLEVTVHLNQILSRLNTDHQWVTLRDCRSRLLFSRDSRVANRSTLYEGNLVREVSVLDQYEFLADSGVTIQGLLTMDTIVQWREQSSLYEHSPYVLDAVAAIKRSKDADRLRLNPVDAEMIQMISPETIPVVFILLAYKEAKGSIRHYVGQQYDISVWWDKLARDQHPLYTDMVKAYVRAVRSSGFVHDKVIVSSAPVMYTRDLMQYSMWTAKLTGFYKSWIPLVEDSKRVLPQICEFIPEYIYEEFEVPAGLERHEVPWQYILRWWNYQRDNGTDVFMTVMTRERRRLQLENRLAQGREAAVTENARAVAHTA